MKNKYNPIDIKCKYDHGALSMNDDNNNDQNEGFKDKNMKLLIVLNEFPNIESD